jgi:hypothetical protein
MRLWTDAICINQQDLDERGHQVQLMGSIYRNAHMVIVWLGTDDDKVRDIPGLAGSRQALRLPSRIVTFSRSTQHERIS